MVTIVHERALAPSLTPGQVVVMDNPSAQEAERVSEPIEGRGCGVRLLPGYSPDLSHIEEPFSKVKRLLRKAEARSRRAPGEAIASALDAVTSADSQAYLRYRNYGTAAQ
jgi:transposase